ncbi:MAG: hypothetical protein SAK29_13330 [Scytonema sp. PMC 1069.18]|nr:hypothetical protein [Scytonema sp. PMC 1069.18]MEC4884972.1 hypothetical protein [Scytonema sp. PMC 1070.18]
MVNSRSITYFQGGLSEQRSPRTTKFTATASGSSSSVLYRRSGCRRTIDSYFGKHD